MNPASDYCQRWSKGTHSWRHRSEGGFDPRLYDVVPLVEKTARAFVVDEHYAASFPAARFSIGLLTRDDRYPINGAIVDGMALAGVATAEMAMADLGLPVKLGSGVAAAQEHYRSTAAAALKAAA